MENTMKLNGVNLDFIKLQLFPFSLRDIVATWFESLPYRSMTTRQELVEACDTLNFRGNFILFFSFKSLMYNSFTYQNI